MLDGDFLGCIHLFAGNVVPKGWLPCDGRQMSIAQNQTLFSLLMTTYGGDVSAGYFNLPDLRGRTPVGISPDYPQGQAGGTEGAGVYPTQMPAHTHALMASTAPADSTSIIGNVYASTVATASDPAPAIYAVPAPNSMIELNSDTLGPAGGSMPHENRQPSLALQFFICVAGVYPIRN